MSRLESPEPVLFFVSWISDKAKTDKTLSLLSHFFSEQLETLYPVENPSLDYYAKEMGAKDKLMRGITFFKKPQAREKLLEAKLWCQAQEEHRAKDNQRSINLDPGYLALEQLVLATGKKYSHRVYLAQGVYAELCLQFQQGAFKTLPWTYPDYQDPKKLAFFLKMREHLKSYR